MDYQKLLFAAAVHKIAAAGRENERKQVEDEYAGAEEADRQDALGAWDNEYPLSSFVPAAYAEIAEVAKQVEAFWEAERSAGVQDWINDLTSV